MNRMVRNLLALLFALLIPVACHGTVGDEQPAPTAMPREQRLANMGLVPSTPQATPTADPVDHGSVVRILAEHEDGYQKPILVLASPTDEPAPTATVSPQATLIPTNTPRPLDTFTPEPTDEPTPTPEAVVWTPAPTFWFPKPVCTGYVNTKVLNVRDAPGLDGHVVGTLYRGAGIEIQAVLGEWYQIPHGGGIHYVFAAYVTLDELCE